MVEQILCRTEQAAFRLRFGNEADEIPLRPPGAGSASERSGRSLRWSVALPENRETRLRCFRNALRNWNFTGYITFKELAAEWLSSQLSEYVPRDIGCALMLHVESGGEIDEQPERRRSMPKTSFITIFHSFWVAHGIL